MASRPCAQRWHRVTLCTRCMSMHSLWRFGGRSTVPTPVPFLGYLRRAGRSCSTASTSTGCAMGGCALTGMSSICSRSTSKSRSEDQDENTATTRSGGSAMSEVENKRLIRRYYEEVLNQGKLGVLDE